jgi:TonB-dependent SusC/RagA subfamily outer membrane receptor
MKWKIAFVLLLSCFLFHPSFSQKANNKIKITGSVVDANGKPVEGVLILVDEEKTDMVTNARGVYNVRVLPTARTITAFSLFNGVKEMNINGQPIVNIVLDGVSTKTSEPVQNESSVVDIGYGTTKKDQVLNSVTSVDRSKANQRSYSNIYDMIASEIPGAQVSGKSVRLQQGPGSFYSSTEPLYILDGVPVTQIDNINPADVGSMEALKGPSASIYGTRGSNGVIIITTRK